MSFSGDANITIVDGGATVVVPSASVQLVIGTSTSGTAAQIVATKNPQTLQSTFGAGKLVEAAAYPILAGGTVLAMRAAKTASGTATAVTFVGTGTSVITITLDGTNGAFDDYYIVFKVTLGGTIATGPISFQISLDAGRTFGPVLSLGVATTYVIPNTGVTLNFAAGTLVTGDQATASTAAPTCSNANVQACINAFQASQYSIGGIGSAHILGTSAGADATAFDGYLGTLANGYIFTRTFVDVRDASPAAKWGGTGETESVWSSSIQTDYSATSAKRVCAGAGHWNMPSAYANAAYGAPRYRRNMAWAAAARQVTVPPQRHLGRFRDGALGKIVVDPVNDPLDGFIYHDDRVTPGLDYFSAGTGGRFMTTRTRIGQQGVFVSNPLSLAPLGSDFALLPNGLVMDVACSIVHQTAQLFVNDDLRVIPPGNTIDERDARTIENTIYQTIQSFMIATKMISAASVVVDRTNNLLTTKVVNITITITGRAYVLQENLTIGFQNVAAAAGGS